MSMGHVLIWPNIMLLVNVVFQDILPLTRVRPIVSSKKGSCAEKMQSLVMYKCKSFVTYLYCLGNGILIPISYTHYT